MKTLSSESLVSDARAACDHVDVAEAIDLLDAGEIVVVDVREKHEVDSGTIRGAIHASRGLLEFYLDVQSEDHIADLVPGGRRLVFVCRSGSRAALATKLANDFGYDAVCLTGGFKAWTKAGGPIE